ncbi:restriction endonuclease subunit S [Marinomonas fungiae]|uniref:Restriction endonuclease S subunit n=1 Tax=Marinomonas fungiae TaxID=1137284 RepID=A0A0K6ISK6_9GAMM|nr:restriction endonuclease subunit S [Marinomonas fungiae]CUB06081.1 Restriction endonuclease S subunit [Marinomonas fungiae]
MSEYRLKDLVKIKNGRDHKSLADGVYPVYGSGGLMRMVDSYLYDKPSILLPRKGTLNNIQYSDQPFWTVDTLYYTEINQNKVDAYYLYYYLKLLDLNSLSSGTGVPSMTFGAYNGIKVKLPQLDIQKKISTLLRAIDKKIELNNRINAELEAMAKTLYDYWFVQFDFPDDSPQGQGKPYKTSGGKMVYNPTLKREIPEGWDWKPVSSIIEVKDGTHDSPKPSDSGQYLITSKHLKPSGIDFSDAYLISQEDFDAVNKRSKVDEGDFLLSMIGTIGLSQWAMKIETPYAIKNIGLFKTSQAPEMADYIYAAVTSLHGKAYLQQNQSTGTSQPYVTLGTLRSIPILIPNEKVFEQFNGKIKPIHKLMYENITENQKLAQLRDWLLPMLMNGQVTVGEAS